MERIKDLSALMHEFKAEIEVKRANPREMKITQADIDALPGFAKDLCNECKKLGYCKLRAQRSVSISAPVSYDKISDDEISNFVWLGIREGDYHYGEFSRKHLQVAFDAFHQQDYETSILNAQAVLAEKTDCGAALFCIAASYYFLGEYAEAMDYASRSFNDWHYRISSTTIGRFIFTCELALSKKAKVEEKAIGDGVNDAKEFVKTTVC